MKTVRTIIFILVLSCLLGCEQLKLDNYATGDRSVKTIDLATTNSNLAEVTSPQIIKDLSQELTQYSPQVKIIAPKAEKTFNQKDVAIKLEVEDLPIFQDDRLHLGNHLNLIVDNEPFQSIYSLDEPVIIKNLAPGTHTIRVFAVSPWGESFKNKGAYAQTTFNVLTETNTNRPNSDLPLLTYNSPTGTYGAEPVLLDFYLNYLDSAIGFASPKGIAKNNSNNQKWLVKATVNGKTSFIIEDWQAYYLTGFEPGDNWIQLELIDEFGNTIENIFNNTVRVFSYNPQQQDNLAKLVSNKITFDDAQSIVKQSYYIQPEGTPEIIDFEDSAKPKIIPSELETIPEESPEVAPEITNQANKPKSEVITTQAKRISPVESPIQPSNPQTKVLNEVSDAETETTTDTDLIVKTETDSDSLDLDSKAAATQVKPKPSVSKILITESNSPKETVAEIIIPQSKSIEIAESNIAIAIPATQSEGDSAESESTSVKFLWWKKILVGVRQTIEALARQLPSEV
jgi:hypothetical protein